jgi:hypothetical protein
MKDFEDFLLTEFEEQHNNIREVERSSIQTVQFFFSIESLLIGGVLSIASVTSSLRSILEILFVIFWLLFLFGHHVYTTSIRSMVNMIKLNFSNTLVRLYYGHSSSQRNYMLFTPNTDALLARKPGNWEKHRDNSVSLARFVGLLNSFNLTTALLLTIYSINAILANQLFRVDTSSQIVIILLLAVAIGILIARLYDFFFFRRIIRREEKNTLTEQTKILRRIVSSGRSKNPE